MCAGQATEIGWPGSGPPRTSRRELREGVVTLRVSQRSKEFARAAEALFGAAKTMTDHAVADQLRTLAEDYQRRAEKASEVDAAKAGGSLGCSS
jgi:hypothetical protein